MTLNLMLQNHIFLSAFKQKMAQIRRSWHPILPYCLQFLARRRRAASFWNQPRFFHQSTPAFKPYLAPLSSTKLHHEVKAYGESLRETEIAYVVRINRGKVVWATEPVLTFSHPNWAALIRNSRWPKLQSHMTKTNMEHWFVDYFEALLYKDVKLVISPASESKGMVLWFLILFPLSYIVYIKGGKIKAAHLRRRTASQIVLYECCITEPCSTLIHKPNGHSHPIWLEHLNRFKKRDCRRKQYRRQEKAMTNGPYSKIKRQVECSFYYVSPRCQTVPLSYFQYRHQ